ncbi:hypothetical protein F5Y19DRAFT_25704 [Xylariaceae sp. FL1651]|nr:hypothetical protein F5Y19DRAFT_25704 [Xylariaceae sp. FL1651]
MYKILFPNVAQIASSYYEGDESQHSLTTKQPPEYYPPSSSIPLGPFIVVLIRAICSDEAVLGHLSLADDVRSCSPEEESGQNAAHATDHKRHHAEHRQDSRTKRREPPPSDDDGEANEDDGRRRRRKTNPEDNDLLSNRREYFACPFFQHNPLRYRRKRSCPGPGWPTISRLKEHLHRQHRLPKHPCFRCWESFEDSELLKKHWRRLDACLLSPEPKLEGIDDSLEEKLKSRKGACKLSETSKWVQIYETIFPGEVVPSPYYEYTRPQPLFGHNIEVASQLVQQGDNYQPELSCLGESLKDECLTMTSPHSCPPTECTTQEANYYNTLPEQHSFFRMEDE